MNPVSDARPTGVSVLGWLCLCSSLLLLIAVAAGYSHPDIFVQWHLVTKRGDPTLQKIEVGDFILFALPSAIASAVIGFGLLTLRSWARWAVLIFFGLSLCRMVTLMLGLFVATNAKFTVTPPLAIAAVINAMIVYYITRPKVKDAFGEGTDYRV